MNKDFQFMKILYISLLIILFGNFFLISYHLTKVSNTKEHVLKTYFLHLLYKKSYFDCF